MKINGKEAEDGPFIKKDIKILTMIYFALIILDHFALFHISYFHWLFPAYFSFLDG